MNKIMIVFGTRPQIIKTSVLADEIEQQGISSVLVHTGQHYDPEMSDMFFSELQLRKPNYNLQVGSGPYRYQISAGVSALLEVIDIEKPSHILTIGDSNSAIVGSIGAIVRKINLSHSEAGLRSGNTREPEELNRVFVDVMSDKLFASTEECVSNLRSENIIGEIILTGDLLCDVKKMYLHLSHDKIPSTLHNQSVSDFCLFTIHRASNVRNLNRLNQIIEDLISNNVETQIIWPVHPGVAKVLKDTQLLNKIKKKKGIYLLPPVSYLEMQWLLHNCSIVITDSVGLQVEAYLSKKPSVIIRGKMEYNILETMGWSFRYNRNKVVDLDLCVDTANKFKSCPPKGHDANLFGSGRAAHKMILAIKSDF